MAVLAWITLLIAGAFSGQPVVYLLMIGLLLFFGFLLDSAGKAMPATLILILGSTIPLVVAQSDDAAAGIAGALVGAMAIALLAVWIAFALFPAASAVAAAARASRPCLASRRLDQHAAARPRSPALSHRRPDDLRVGHRDRQHHPAAQTRRRLSDGPGPALRQYPRRRPGIDRLCFRQRPDGPGVLPAGRACSSG